MRSLKTIISDVKEVSGKKQSLENDLRQKKRKITDPYDLRQLIYGVLVISLPLTVWLLWIEWNEGIIYNPSWPLEIDHYPWYLQMISFVLTPIACIGVISVIVFVCIALVWLYIEEVFNKKFGSRVV